MQDINLYQLLKFYVKKWYWILLLTAFGVVAGVIYNDHIQTPLYKSNATLILVSPGETRSAQDATLINNYLQLFKSRRVLEPVIKEQNLDIDYDTLVKSIEAMSEKNTEVIKVAISSPDAEMSRDLVKGSVESFKHEAEELYDLDNIRLVDDASYPERPYNVFKEFVLIASSLAGFVVALLGLFFVYDYRLTQKPATKTKPVDSKVSRKKKKLSPYQRFVNLVSFKKQGAKKQAPRKKAAATKPKTKIVTEASPPTKSKKPASKKPKQSRKGK